MAALEREKSSKADTFSFFFVAQVTERQWVKYDCTQVSAFLVGSFFTVSLINEPQRKGKTTPSLVTSIFATKRKSN